MMTTDAAEGGSYFAADAEADDELARLKLLEALCDPWTFRCLDGIGVRQGWRCLEVGAGAGSVGRPPSQRGGGALACRGGGWRWAGRRGRSGSEVSRRSARAERGGAPLRHHAR